MSIVADEYLQTVEVPTWGDLVFRNLPVRPDAVLLVFPGRRVTYAEFAEAVIARARSLAALGLKRGDHIGIIMPSSVEYLELLFAAASIGVVSVVVNSRYRSHELSYVVENADLRVVFTAGRVAEELDYAERLCETFPALREAQDKERLRLVEAPLLEKIVLFDEARPGFIGQADFEARGEAVDVREVHRRRHDVRLSDALLMMYTSGTTSLPKGCLLSHESVVRTVQHVARCYRMTPEDRYWTPLPLFHMGSLNPLGAVLWTGGAFLCSPRFEAGQALEMLEAEKATLAFLAFPAIINDLVAHPDIATRDLSGIRAMMSSAAVQPVAVRRRLVEAFPDVIQTGMYGMTEGGGASSCTAVDDGPDAGLRALGRPFPGVSVKIIREDGSEADVGEVGEILFDGYGTFKCYYRNPEKTAETFYDGWIHSGDLGSINSHGELMFHGRAKDMLKVGGENVASAEIEEFMHQHPAVKLCQVVGAPDDRLAEVPAAFIELHEGATASAEELIAFCNGRISAFKVPRHVRFVTEWPLTASSKVQKRALAEQIAAECNAVAAE